MAKNYASIYNSSNDASAIEQKWYAKLEATRGTMVAPSNSDFFFTLQGGTITYSQPIESSPHRSGRHHTSFIKKKKETSFSFSTYFNIDESLGAAAVTEVDAPVKLFFKSLFGKQDDTGNTPTFTTEDAPDITFTLIEAGDKWARQARAAFIQGCNQQFPGNGEATCEWTGDAAEAYHVGIAKSTTNNNAGNTLTLLAGEGDLIPVGAMIMIIEADGTTRSADTPAGSMRLVTAKTGDVLTVNGAVLADADGSVALTPIYVSYYEPSAPTAINNPVTGLSGSMVVAGLTHDCFRSATLNMQNNHEKVDYCYGTDGLGNPYFVPGDRFTAELSIEINLNEETLKLFNRIQEEFEAQDVTIVLGEAAGRRYRALVPKVQFSVPSFAVPDSGSIPITFSGTAYQTALDAADEVTAAFL